MILGNMLYEVLALRLEVIANGARVNSLRTGLQMVLHVPYS
jgi:hypothetical protein